MSYNDKVEGYLAEYYAYNGGDQPLTIISDIEEYNGAVVSPGDTLKMSIFIPKGLRPWSMNGTLKDRPIRWVGMLDAHAPELN